MILKPTVFVLGAGASIPYGFPSGPELAGNVRARCEPGAALHKQLKLMGAPDDLLSSFSRELALSGRESIDSFLEARGEFLSIAKWAMAMELGPLESDARLQQSPSDDDWMGYLFNKMGTTIEGFRRNRLKVVTLNFERSFERRMFLGVKSAFGLSDKDADHLLTEVVPILHLHGDLGPPGWGNASPGETARAYVPLNPEDLAKTRRGAYRIRVVHEEIGEETVSCARQWLMEAEQVCFLGCSYHPTTMKRLDVVSLKEPQSNGRGRNVVGTAFGLAKGEVFAVRQLFDNVFTEIPLKAKQFLRETNFVHEML